MVWYSPPSRREVSLVLFSLTTFTLFYNLESSFTSDGLSLTSQSNHKGANSANSDWDEVIYGNWTWEEEQVAENARKQAKNNTVIPVSLHPQIFGSVGVNEGILDWGDEVPTTMVLKHAPGALGIGLSCSLCSDVV